jgi:hypothetical protein
LIGLASLLWPHVLHCLKGPEKKTSSCISTYFRYKFAKKNNKGMYSSTKKSDVEPHHFDVATVRINYAPVAPTTNPLAYAGKIEKV